MIMKIKTAVILVICIILALAAGAAGSKTSGKGSGNRKGDRYVDTGDESHIGLWLTIAILAALEFSIIAFMRRRRSHA